jgi:hypothetical protein
MVHEIVHLKSQEHVKDDDIDIAGDNLTGETPVETAFDAVAKFLVPFPLSPNHSQLEKSLLSMKYGKKDYGDRGDEIDEYIKQML